MKLSVREQLLKYLQTNDGWYNSGALQRMEFRGSRGLATGKTISRRLQELAEEQLILVDHSRGSAQYSADKAKIPPRYKLEYDPHRNVMIKTAV